MRRAFLAIAIILSAGCGGRATYPVEGTVVWGDGTPATELAGGMVLFDLITSDAQEAVSPHGAIQQDGSYVLSTFRKGDGVPAGRYRVQVVPLIWTEGMLGDKPAPPPVLDPRFSKYETAQIEVVVEPRPNRLPIKVEKIGKAPSNPPSP